MKFERTSDGVLLSSITPVYNILPLLTRYCRNRFGREPWALFDEKREFGMRNLHGQIIRYENTCKPKVGRDASIPLSSVSDSGKQISHTIGQSDQHGYNASALRMYA